MEASQLKKKDLQDPKVYVPILWLGCVGEERNKYK